MFHVTHGVSKQLIKSSENWQLIEKTIRKAFKIEGDIKIQIYNSEWEDYVDIAKEEVPPEKGKLLVVDCFNVILPADGKGHAEIPDESIGETVESMSTSSGSEQPSDTEPVVSIEPNEPEPGKEEPSACGAASNGDIVQAIALDDEAPAEDGNDESSREQAGTSLCR